MRGSCLLAGSAVPKRLCALALVGSWRKVVDVHFGTSCAGWQWHCSCLTAAPGEAIAPRGLPRRSSIGANGAHFAWNRAGGTRATPSHRQGCGDDCIWLLGDPQHPRLVPAQVAFRRGHLPAAWNHREQRVSCWHRRHGCCSAQLPRRHFMFLCSLAKLQRLSSHTGTQSMATDA